MKNNKILICAFVLYLVSLCLPGVTITGINGEYTYYGYLILLFGWLAMTEWVFAWFANPIFLFVLFRSRVERAGIMLFASIFSLCLGLMAFTLRTFSNFETGREEPVQLAIGYYVWLGALALLVLHSFLRFMPKENSSSEGDRGGYTGVKKT
jgi:hypothetical protein